MVRNNELVECKHEFGHSQVRQTTILNPVWDLGKTLSEDRAAKLVKLGFVWQVYTQHKSWMAHVLPTKADWDTQCNHSLITIVSLGTAESQKCTNPTLNCQLDLSAAVVLQIKYNSIRK